MSPAHHFGLLYSQTGVTAAVETTQLNASLLAIEQINRAGGINGRAIEPVIYDPGSQPKRFAACATQMLERDHLRLIFGCYMSSTRKAVLPLVEAQRGLLFYPTLYEGFEYSPNCIYTGAAPNQNCLQLAQYLFRTYGKRFLLIGSNYVYPYETNRIMTDLVRQGAGSVVDEIYVPLEANLGDFDKTITTIGRTRPDVVFSTVVGEATAIFYEAYRMAGFDASAMPIASLTTSEAEVAQMDEATARGHVTAAPFFENLPTEAAQEFVSAYRRKFGWNGPVPAAAEAAYFQIMLAAQAVEQCGSEDPGLIVAALPEIDYAAPQGRVRVDRDNNHTYLWPRVARVGERGQFDVVWSTEWRVKPDPYCVTQTLDDRSRTPRERTDA